MLLLFLFQTIVGVVEGSICCYAELCGCTLLVAGAAVALDSLDSANDFLRRRCVCIVYPRSGDFVGDVASGFVPGVVVIVVCDRHGRLVIGWCIAVLWLPLTPAVFTWKDGINLVLPELLLLSTVGLDLSGLIPDLVASSWRSCRSCCCSR